MSSDTVLTDLLLENAEESSGLLSSSLADRPVGLSNSPRMGHFKLVVWKNYLTLFRQGKAWLLWRLFTPLLYLAILAYLSTLDIGNVTLYPREDVPAESPVQIIQAGLADVTIHVVPDNQFVKDFTNQLDSSFGRLYVGKNLGFEYYATKEDLQKKYDDDSTKVHIALYLPDRLSTHFNYTINLNPDDTWTPQLAEKNAGLETCRKETSCPADNYYQSMFLSVQQLVDDALKRPEPSGRKKINIVMQNYPKDPYCQGWAQQLRLHIPLLAVIPFAQVVSNILQRIVEEKKNKSKDGLRIVGVSDLSYWLPWMALFMVETLVVSVMYTIAFGVFNIIPTASPALIFVVTFLFGVSCITMSFLLSAFFQEPKTAGAVGVLLTQLFSMLFIVQVYVEKARDYLIPLRLVSSLAFTTVFDESISLICSDGFNISDMVPGGSAEGIFYSILFLALDSVLYLILAIYLDNVLPNELGMRNHWLYFLGSDRKRAVPDYGDEMHTSIASNLEFVPEDLRATREIVIQNVRKTYDGTCRHSGVPAVKGISLEVYKGEITAILGKNGAGKSTLVHILAGLIPPTSGTASILGLDATDAKQRLKIQQQLGICLQWDLHFDFLTVEEHLLFYCKLREFPAERIDSEITQILREFGLTEKRKSLTKTLSGGQKRKLSVAIALVGDPKIVILDEPTASLDPAARRSLWTILKRKKKDRVILLTTHFMDEADVLADRKAIVHNGVLKCYGSSLFLKSKYGAGHYLTVDVPNENGERICDEIMQTLMPEALNFKTKVQSGTTAATITYPLPLSGTSDAANIAPALARIEDAVNTRECTNYGISMTSLENVFLKISSESDFETAGTTGPQGPVNLMQECGSIQRNSLHILMSLCMIRARRLYRSPSAIVSYCVIPLIMVAVTMIFLAAQGKAKTAVEFYQYDKIYKDLAICVNETVDTGFLKFLKDKGIKALPYSGVYKDLLNVNMPQGTAAAFTIANEGPDQLNALVNVNGTFVQIPPIAVSLLHEYTSNSKPWGKVDFSRLVSRESMSAQIQNLVNAIVATFLFGPVLVYVFIYAMVEIVREKEKHIRSHLRINGVSIWLYFLSTFLVFGSLTFVTVLVVLVFIQAFQVEVFMNVYAMTILGAGLIFFILPASLLTYVMSYIWTNAEKAQTVFSSIINLSSFIFGIIVIVIDLVKPQIVVYVHFIAASLNVYYIPTGLFYYVAKQAISRILFETPVSWDLFNIVQIWGLFIVMAVQVPVYIALLYVCESTKYKAMIIKAAKRFLKRENTLHAADQMLLNDEETNDVLDEKQLAHDYVNNPNSSGHVLGVSGLRKSYVIDGKETEVVQGVDFVVAKNQVFGLLGHNGAGKTTVMKMITAEEVPKSGKVKIAGYIVTSNMSEAFQHLGFCPQHDALWELVTLEEHLKFYATLRGVTGNYHGRIIDVMTSGLQIQEHRKKQAQKLSGGTKRKLSYAMSTLGNPRIVLLDEPTTGMDPQSKRFLWNTVLGSIRDDRGAILTTHSMEEADILCNKIGILVKGKFMCIGTPQYLKSTYGTGYTLEIKIDPSRVSSHVLLVRQESTVSGGGSGDDRRGSSARRGRQQVQLEIPDHFRFVTKHFSDATLVECFEERAVFSVPTSSVNSVSKAFAVLESLKSNRSIIEYSFSQTTLEQVFLEIAKYE